MLVATERRQLQERGPAIQQQMHTLAWQQLPAAVKLVALGFLGRMDLGLDVAEALDLGQHVLSVLLKIRRGRADL